MQTLSAVLSVVNREQCCSDIRVEAMLYWSTPGVSSCRRCAKNFPQKSLTTAPLVDGLVCVVCDQIWLLIEFNSTSKKKKHVLPCATNWIFLQIDVSKSSKLASALWWSLHLSVALCVCWLAKAKIHINHVQGTLTLFLYLRSQMSNTVSMVVL